MVGHSHNLVPHPGCVRVHIAQRPRQVLSWLLVGGFLLREFRKLISWESSLKTILFGEPIRAPKVVAPETSFRNIALVCCVDVPSLQPSNAETCRSFRFGFFDFFLKHPLPPFLPLWSVLRFRSTFDISIRLEMREGAERNGTQSKSCNTREQETTGAGSALSTSFPLFGFCGGPRFRPVVSLQSLAHSVRIPASKCRRQLRFSWNLISGRGYLARQWIL